MESFAARGAADSIRDIAQAAQPLPQQLYTLSITNDSYSEDIRIIANDLKTFSHSLNTLSRLLGDSKSRYSDYIFRLIADIIKKSGKIHDKIRKIMEKLSNNGKGTWKLGVKFVYMESQIRKLLSGLRDMKVRLVNISQILQADLQLNDDMSIPITSKIQRPPGKSLQPETLRILQKAQKSIMPKGITNNKHSTEPIHGSENNTHISITHFEDHQLERPGVFLLSSTTIDPALNLPEYLNYHESSTSPFITTKGPLVLPPNISDLPPVVERDLKSQSIFRSIDASKETTYDATKHGITPSTGLTSQPPEDDFSASRSLKSSSSVDSFKTATPVQEHGSQIARKVKGVQSVMHAFRIAMQTLGSLIDSRISKTDGELFVAAKGLESSLNDGMVEIDHHHMNYFKQYGHIYLQLFDTGLSHDIQSIGSEVMTNVVVQLLESLAEHEELHAYQFDSLSKYAKEISFRTNHCLTLLASNVVIESKSSVISSSTAFGFSKVIGLNESRNKDYNTATLSEYRDEPLSAVDLSSREDLEEIKSSSSESRGWSAIAASIMNPGMRTAGASSSDNNTKSSWGWFDRKKFMPLSRKNTIVDPQNFGPANSLHGFVTEPVGFGEVPSWTSDSDFGEQRDRYPKSQAPRDGLGTSQQSLQPYPIPIQQPLPLIPVSQSAYESIFPFRSESDGILKQTVSSSRTSSLAQTVLTGVSGAALDAAIASNIHDRKDVKRVDDHESPANERQKHWESESADAARGARRREPGRNILEHHDAEMRIKRPDFHNHYTKSEVAISTASIDPFEYQVEDGSFFNPTAGSSPDFHVPSVVTVEREPDFTRKQYYSIKDPGVISNAGLEVEYFDKDESNRQSSGREGDGLLHEAEETFDETEHFNAPFAAAVIGAAVAAEHHRESKSDKRQSKRRGKRDSYDYKSRDKEQDKTYDSEAERIQEEANRACREIIISRKITSSVISSQGPSSDQSVVDKYSDNKDEGIFRGITPPGIEEHKKKGLYDAPNADFQLDHVIGPLEMHTFKIPSVSYDSAAPRSAFFKQDPDAERPRPFLNLCCPTPTQSPVPEKQQERYETSRLLKTKEYQDSDQPNVKSSDIVTSPKISVGISPTSSSISKGVTGSQNETKHFEVESSSDQKDEFISAAEFQLSGSEPKGWGAIAARIMVTDIGAAAASLSYTSNLSEHKENNDKEIDTTYGYHGAVMEPEKVLRRYSPPQREKDQNLPSTSPKPSAPRSSHLPGAFDDDLDFTSTIATGLQNAGFDPNIVIDDPSFRRRAPPPGSISPGIYYAPFAQTVSDFNDTPSSFMASFEPEDAVEEPVEESESWFISRKKSKKNKRVLVSRKEVPDTAHEERTVFVPVDAFDDLKTGEDEWIVTKKSGEGKKKRKSLLWDSPPGFRDVVSDQSQLSRSIDSSERQTELYEPQLEESSLPPSRASKESHDGNYDDYKSRKSSNRDSDIFNSADRDQSQSVASVDTSPYIDSTSRRKKKSRRISSGDEKRKSRNSKRYSVHDTSSLYSSVGAETVGDLPESASDESNGKYHYEDNFSDDVRSDSKTRRKSASRFRSTTSTKKDNFLDNAGTIGAGVGIAGAAVAITAQHQRQSKAPNTTAVEISEHIQSINAENSAMTDEIIEPESTERRFRPSIDPQYGDLLPLPPSDPASPSIESLEELPVLPESRPDTPDNERLSRDKGIKVTVRALQEIPMKSPSQGSIPLVFKIGNRGAASSSTLVRSPDSQSPVVPKTDPLGFPKSRYSRPISWDKSVDYKPLFLVEAEQRNSAVQIQEPDDVHPELPSIKHKPPSTDELKLNKHQKAVDDYQAMPPKLSSVDPITKDRSSYLLQSSPMFEKISDDRDALHIIQERESTDFLLPTVGPEFSKESPSLLSEEAEFTPTSKWKKGKKKKKSSAWPEDDDEIKATGERRAAREELADRIMEQKSKVSNPLRQTENEYESDKRTDAANAGAPKNDTESETSKLSSITLPFHPNLSTLGIDTSNEHILSTLAYPALSSNQTGKLWWQAYASLIPSSSASSSSESLAFTLIKKGLQSELGIPVSKHFPDDTICRYTSNSIRRISTALHHDKPQLADVLEIRSDILRIVTTMEIQLGLEIAALGWGCVLALLSLYEKVIAASINAISTTFLETSLTHLKIIVAIIARHTVMENLSQQTGDTLSFKAEYRSALISLCTQILEYLAITFKYAETEISVLTEGNSGRKDTQRNVYLIENQRQEGLQKCAFLVELIKQKDETCQKYGVVVDMKDESSSESDESDNKEVGDASDEDWG